MPSFWLGMLLIMLVLAVWGVLPPLGTISIFADPMVNLSQMIWPAISVGYRYSSVVARMLRSSILEVLSEDYISCLLYTSPSPRDMRRSRMPSSA